MFLHNETLVICETDYTKKCLRLEGGSWTEYNSLNDARDSASSVSTSTTNFIFGGYQRHDYTFEYLEQNSNDWMLGTTNLPYIFYKGCAVAISQNEIWLIGGSIDGGEPINNILSFNVSSQTFSNLSIQLLDDKGRYSHKCTKIPGTQSIIVTGGDNGKEKIDTTEIIDIENMSVIKSGSMHFIRADHGIGILNIDNHDRVVVFGGSKDEYGNNLKSVEVFNTQSEKWEISNIELSEARSEFGFLTIKNNPEFK